jgi:phage terminase large subunit-like protein
MITMGLQSNKKTGKNPKLFNYDKAKPSEKVEYFFSRFLTHSKGEHAGKPFIPADWQMNDIIKPFFDTLRKDGLRQYRTMPICLPRKNGKSTLCSALALYFLCADGELGAEVICAAGSRDQAAIVFEIAASMVRNNPNFEQKCTVFKREIVHQNGSRFRCIAADGKLQHGLNCSAIMMDELHVWPDRELYEALTTSVLARRQPSVIMISTAGYDRESLWHEIYSRGRAVADARTAGQELDETMLPVIYEAPPEADWRIESTWKAANPGYNVSVKPDYFRQKVNEALASPAEEQSFRRLHLNQWTQSSTRWLNMERFDACAAPLPDLKGRACWAGLDLSSTQDLSALVLAFPYDDKIILKPFAWAPTGAVKERERRNKQRYDQWAAKGHLTLIEGEVIDYSEIKAQIMALASEYRIREIAIDRWNAAQLAQELQQEGLAVVAFGQGYASMSPAAKAAESLVLQGRLWHDGHPVQRWCWGNAVIESDSAGNIKPSKSKSTEKIDLCVAGVMAIARAQLGEVTGTSVYEGRGLGML